VPNTTDIQPQNDDQHRIMPTSEPDHAVWQALAPFIGLVCVSTRFARPLRPHIARPGHPRRAHPHRGLAHCLVGCAPAMGLPAIAWLEQSALLLLLGGAVVVGVGAPLWWRYTKDETAP
jgi:hypothetical protein